MSDLDDELVALHRRFVMELEYNDAKGSGAYRQGMHDGLHFAADALADILRAHDLSTDDAPAQVGTIPPEYGV